MKSGWRILVLVLAPALVPAMADTLTFPNNVCSANTDGSGPMGACAEYSWINEAYGDTATVDVQYKNLSNPAYSLRWWDGGYNNLSSAAFAAMNDGSNVEILLAPVGNHVITLNSFDVGAWYHRVGSTNLSIVDGNGSVLFNYGLQTIGTGDVASHYAPAISSSNGIGIVWGAESWNVGVGNVDFTVDGTTSSVPEPSSLLLIGTCIAICARRIVRRPTL